MVCYSIFWSGQLIQNVPQTSPMMQFETTQTQSPAQHQNEYNASRPIMKPEAMSKGKTLF